MASRGVANRGDEEALRHSREHIESHSNEVALDKELILISFDGIDTGQAAEYAQELADYIREAREIREALPGEVEIHPLRDNREAQSLGTTIGLILLGAAAKGLALTVVALIRHYVRKGEWDECH